MSFAIDLLCGSELNKIIVSHENFFFNLEVNMVTPYMNQ